MLFNNDNKFDIDLKFGQIREERIAKMLSDDKIEVKVERGMWRNTGNIAIEYECNGKPSGLATTEAEWWWHSLEDDGEPVCDLVFRVDKLKALARDKSLTHVTGGDNKASKMVLLPLDKIFERKE